MAARNGLLGTLGTLGVVAWTALPALAAPPVTGSTHTFHDPVFNGTVVCDTLDQIRDIATSETPDDTYGLYRVTANDLDEPTCMAIVPTGVVLDVAPLGIMEKGGERYNAWAIETDIGGVTAYALYLERIDVGLSA